MKSNGNPTITVRVHLFNSLSKYREEIRNSEVILPKRSTPRDVLDLLHVPSEEVHFLMINGRTPEGPIPNLKVVLSDRDRLAFSGPIPFSRIYRTPVI